MRWRAFQKLSQSVIPVKAEELERQTFPGNLEIRMSFGEGRMQQQ